jgi:hypothetical protein
MMNQSLFNKEDFGQLARFKLLMRQVHHCTVDLSDLVADPQYAKDTLDLAEDTDHEELMLLAIELRARLGLLSQTMQPEPTPPSVPTAVVNLPTPAVEAATAPNANERYRFSLR